ncbi:TadE family protein [Novipirellula artificiosorum]|uniref:TadE-like protein n=1 Tax=Novipirellula artificiosorum TaxID=2528016 RepID=A0A5C6DJE0_9BACT|nr:TadE family protein [Novipirellula artificiosorum]TWU35019.1 TadE-like protein [Novipirellula artificiosorum]
MELAICLPVLAIILLATVEACVMLQLQQNLSITAYEGARIGNVPGASSEGVQLQCEMLLDDRNIQGYAVTMNPPDPSSKSPGDPFTVTVSADFAANSVFGGIFFQDKTLAEAVVLRAE